MNAAEYLIPADAAQTQQNSLSAAQTQQNSLSAAQTQQNSLSAAQMQQMGLYIAQLGQIVAALQLRLDSLEKESSRKITITHAQTLALGRRMGARARELCEKYQLNGNGDASAFRAAIKKAVLVRWSIRDLHDLPLKSLDAAGDMIDSYASIALVMERRKANEQEASAPGHRAQVQGEKDHG